ncbi:MAG: hypothetical protein P8018_00495 [Acidobacteriota bacterium]
MYHIPVWHPLFVHFPVAFILSAGACSLGWLVLGYKFWRKATLLFLILGFLGGIAAYYTGDNMHEAFRDKPAVRQLVEEHEDMAGGTMAWGIKNSAPPAASQPFTPGRHTPSPSKGPYEGD